MTQCPSRLPGPQCELEAGHDGDCVLTLSTDIPRDAGQMFAAAWDTMDEASEFYRKATRGANRAKRWMYIAVLFNIGAALFTLGNHYLW